MNKLICKICNRKFKSSSGIGSHISTVHKLSVKEYYDIYYIQDNEGICKICGKPTTFISMTEGYHTYCSTKCVNLDIEVRQKLENTTLERYGVTNIFKLPAVQQKVKQSSKSIEVVNKRKNTMKERYGIEATFCREDIQSLIWDEEHSNKRIQTNLERYGVAYTIHTDYAKQQTHSEEANRKSIATRQHNNMIKYGYKEIMSISYFRQKAIDTKRKNGTFNTSMSEESVYNQLISIFGQNDIIRQYKSIEYPFYCDFYIISRNLYIECNFHWTHNQHWFDINLDKDNYLSLCEKAKYNNYYKTAVYVWTKNDIIKRNTAQQNNLNYVVFWKLSDLSLWISKNCPNGKDWIKEYFWI